MTELRQLTDAGGPWRLRDERDFLRRSLDDARREHEAGDLSDDDFAVLVRRDEGRLAEVEAELVVAGARADVPAAPVGEKGDAAAGTPADPGAGPRAPRGWRIRIRGRRRWLAVGGVVVLIAAAVLLVLDLTAPRLPGQSATGSIDLNTQQAIERQLAQARALVKGRHPVEALRLYGQVLTEDPRDPTALAEWGWLDWQAATKAKEATVAAEGASALEEAVRLDPKLFAAQYYLGTVLLQEGAAKKAVVHFAAFLADHPTASWLHDAAYEVRAAYAAAHEPVPSGVPAVTAQG